MNELELLDRPIVTPHYNFMFSGEGLPPLEPRVTRIIPDPACWLSARFWVMPACCPWHAPLQHYSLVSTEVEDGRAVAAECCGYPIAWEADPQGPSLAGLIMGAQLDFYSRWMDDKRLDWPGWRDRYLSGNVDHPRFMAWIEFQIAFDAAQLAGAPFKISEDGRCVTGPEAESWDDVEGRISTDVVSYMRGIQDAHKLVAPLDDEVEDTERM